MQAESLTAFCVITSATHKQNLISRKACYTDETLEFSSIIIIERAVLNTACSYLEVPVLSKYTTYFDLCCLLPKLWILASQKTKSHEDMADKIHPMATQAALLLKEPDAFQEIEVKL